MKDILNNIIQEFLDNVCKELGKYNKDIEYFNYCRGQKEVLQKMKKIVNENEDNYIKLFEELKEQYLLLADTNKDNKDFYVGGANVVSYIIREYNKKVGV